MGMTMLQMAHADLIQDADDTLVDLVNQIYAIYCNRSDDMLATELLNILDPVSKVQDPIKKSQMKHYVELVSMVIRTQPP